MRANARDNATHLYRRQREASSPIPLPLSQYAITPELVNELGRNLI